jgi:plasmid maintenance system antidote protein VapI
MTLGEHLKYLGQSPSKYARRLNLQPSTITRYLNGQRGLSSNSLRVILVDAGGSMTIHDLLPNPYQDKENGEGEGIQK